MQSSPKTPTIHNWCPPSILHVLVLKKIPRTMESHRKKKQKKNRYPRPVTPLAGQKGGLVDGLVGIVIKKKREWNNNINKKKKKKTNTTPPYERPPLTNHRLGWKVFAPTHISYQVSLLQRGVGNKKTARRSCF